MEVLVDMGGSDSMWPEMCECTPLLGLFGWDITSPKTLVDINTTPITVLRPT
jgi:hypothetical protein